MTDTVPQNAALGKKSDITSRPAAVPGQPSGQDDPIRPNSGRIILGNQTFKFQSYNRAPGGSIIYREAFLE